MLNPLPAQTARLLPVLFCVLLAAASRLLFLQVGGLVYDDAYISLRYAANLAAGDGLVYNPGDWVYGASTPLYTLLLAGLLELDLPALPLIRFLAIAADLLVAALWASWLGARNRPFAAFMFGLLFALSPVFAEVTVSGMETSFLLLLMTLALQGALRASRDSISTQALWGAALCGLALVRLEGLALALLLLVVRRRRSGETPWLPGCLLAGAVLAWFGGFALLYGSPLPHSIAAKAAAYNLHRPSVLPNLLDLTAQMAPIRGPWGRLLYNSALLTGLLAALLLLRRDFSVRLFLGLAAAWLLYLIIPKTLLFKWYYPPVLLAALAAAALGAAELVQRLDPVRRVRAAALLAAAAAVGGAGWSGQSLLQTRLLSRAEQTVRREIGLWLRQNTLPTHRVAAEPIGYIGYYSERRILDEVGLVSPDMVDLNRMGDGWFEEMLRRHRPDVVVERPHYLLRNRTLNSGVRLFTSEESRLTFAVDYQLVRLVEDRRLPERLACDYRFGIYVRRSGPAAVDTAQRAARMPPAGRREWVDRAFSHAVRTDTGVARQPSTGPES